MLKQQPRLFASIHLGSENISIQIVEFNNLDNYRIIDQASRPVILGEETFKTGKIQFSTVNEVCELLKGYKRLMDDYGVSEYRLVATTAIREAQNQRYIIDQIKVKTGLHVEVVDMPQEIYYKFVSLSRTVAQHNLIDENEGMLYVDISSGGLGITLVKNNEIKYQQNIHIGVIRIKESFDKNQRESTHFNQALAEYIKSTVSPVKRSLYPYKIKYLVLAGTETELLLKMLGKSNDNSLVIVKPADLAALYDNVKSFKLPQLLQMYGLSENLGEIVLPTIILYKQILSLIQVSEIVIPPDKFLDGITKLYIAQACSSEYMNKLEADVISLAKTIGEKYNYDPRHALCVENFAVLIFDKCSKFHGLDSRSRLLLRIAAILHDIGKYVSLRRHYFYSYRLIISSDILGLSIDEKKIVAYIAYYHSKGTPTISDEGFGLLSREHQVIVAKLAAIIRLADSMDRSHRQKVKKVDIAFKNEEMFIAVAVNKDYSLEEWTFAEKADFFEEVYGIRPVLERQEN